jgi:AIPR protein
MANNNIIILNSILEGHSKHYEGYKEDEIFELFTFEQVLKEHDLSYDEIIFGNVDGGDDGGIDGFFLFLDDRFVGEGYLETVKTEQQNSDETEQQNSDETKLDLSLFRKFPCLELYIIQSKKEESFGEKTFDRLIPTLGDIFDLSKSLDDLKSLYNIKLLDRVDTFRQIYLGLSSLHPELNISIVYASKGNTEDINPKVIHRAEILKEDVKSFFNPVNVAIEYFGARELLNYSRIEKKYTLPLQFIANYLSVGQNSYILLSKIHDYYRFVVDEKNNIRSYMFESNVRDFQGRVEVNKDIIQTLVSLDDGLDFWWLNNGITILASRATISGTIINLENVQIINGLQTTYSIYNYYKNNSRALETENRALSVKIIVIDEQQPQIRDRIIKATNFQTAIQPYSLRATDKIQRDIEDYLMGKGWFYDRRKNHYKNMGKPAAKIISIQQLSQVYMSIILRRPHNARSNPVSLIKSDGNYKRIFNEKVIPDVYLFCAKIIKRIEVFLRKHKEDAEYIKYHLVLTCVIKHLQNKNYTPADLAGLLKVDEEVFSQELMSESLSEVKELAKSYMATYGGDFAKISKTKEFTNYLIENIALSQDSCSPEEDSIESSIGELL